jgi:hypothetical protein
VTCYRRSVARSTFSQCGKTYLQALEVGEDNLAPKIVAIRKVGCCASQSCCIYLSTTLHVDEGNRTRSMRKRSAHHPAPAHLRDCRDQKTYCGAYHRCYTSRYPKHTECLVSLGTLSEHSQSGVRSYCRASPRNCGSARSEERDGRSPDSASDDPYSLADRVSHSLAEHVISPAGLSVLDIEGRLPGAYLQLRRL